MVPKVGKYIRLINLSAAGLITLSVPGLIMINLSAAGILE